MEPAATVYKKKIRREARMIAISLAAFYAVYVVVAIIGVVIALILSGYMDDLISGAMARRGTSLPYTNSELTESLMENISFGWLSIAALLAGSFMLLILRGTRLFTKDLTKTGSRIDIPDFLKMAGLMFGINAVVSLFGVVISLLFKNLGGDSGGSDDIFSQYLMDGPGLLYVVILGPILEEIIFRGAILRSLEPFGKNFAIVVSSLLFGLYHLSLFQGVFAFFIGLILGYCALRFSIKWAMLLHMINNGFAMAITYFDPSLAIALGIYAVMLALAVLAGVFAWGQIKHQIRVGKPTEMHFAARVPVVPWYISPADPRIATYIGQEMALRAKPYHLAFSSPWLIVALSLATVLTLLLTFML